MRLPKDSHWKCDSYQHLKVTGRPFAMMNNLNDATSTRSFLDEPLEREQEERGVSSWTWSRKEGLSTSPHSLHEQTSSSGEQCDGENS